MTRTHFPVVAGIALTVNKAQGLTIKEGVGLREKASREAWRAVRRVNAFRELRHDRVQEFVALERFRQGS